LGYVTNASVKRNFAVQGLRFLIQSAVKDPMYLDGRIDAFVESIPQMLNQNEEEFKVYINTIIAVKREKDKNLNQETARWWQEIHQHTYRFQKEKLEIEVLEKLTSKELLLFFSEYFSKTGRKRRKFSCQLYGGIHVPVFTQTDRLLMITDQVQFKRRSALYPLP